jgi:hypothetical protein
MDETLSEDDSMRSGPTTTASGSRIVGPVPPEPLAVHRGEFIDWRTIDPATIQGEGVPVEELLTYREKLDELLQHAPGQFVLIVGREIISLFPDLDSAARYATEQFGGRPVLIKKVAAVEPIHSLGGAMLEPSQATVGWQGLRYSATPG